MLVLSRRKKESVRINGNIKVTIIEIDQGNVRLSFDAPPEVRIDREEIHEKRLSNPKEEVDG